MYTGRFSLFKNSFSTVLHILVLELHISLSSCKLALGIKSNKSLGFLCYSFKCYYYEVVYMLQFVHACTALFVQGITNCKACVTLYYKMPECLLYIDRLLLC